MRVRYRRWCRLRSVGVVAAAGRGRRLVECAVWRCRFRRWMIGAGSPIVGLSVLWGGVLGRVCVCGCAVGWQS
jgi:hypothetical protein